jgi:N-acetyl-alpha-D-muramate 1-phosphate uridylyltransferase
MPCTPSSAMVLAAGLGVRMRPITLQTPKPLIKVGGRTMLDRVLDRLEEAGVHRVVVNAHWLAEQIKAHLDARPASSLSIALSDEPSILETGGGVKRALPLLGDDPFFVINADIIWLDGPTPTLNRMASRFDPQRMDSLLLLAPTAQAVGYEGRGDYQMDSQGRLTQRQGALEICPFVMAGVSLMTKAQFADAPDGAFSNLELWRKAEEAGRLYGLRHEGNWYHVGTPDAIGLVEMHLKAPASREVHP